MCVLLWMEALKMPKNWSYPTKFVLRLQLIVVVAFGIVEVARFVVDRFKGAHTAASKGVGQKILAQNGSWWSLGSIWGSLTRTEDTRKNKKEKDHFEQLRILCTLTSAYIVAAFKIRQIKSFNSYQRTNRNHSDKIMIIVNTKALHLVFSQVTYFPNCIFKYVLSLSSCTHSQHSRDFPHTQNNAKKLQNMIELSYSEDRNILITYLAHIFTKSDCTKIFWRV